MTVAAPKSAAAAGLPKFTNPPVTEVALSVQFDPLPGLQIHHFGLLWNEYRSRYPLVESHPPIDRAIETFSKEPAIGQPTITFELVNPFMTPRVWFLNASGNELLQVQRDRFIVNWRRVKAEDRYPQYEHVREILEREYVIFEKFLSDHKVGSIVPNQCEVTYINQILTCLAWDKHSQVGRVLKVMAPEFSKGERLPIPENFRFSAQFVMGELAQSLGRLHVDFQPGFRALDKKPLFAMNLTARGRPPTADFAGILAFMNLGRDNIVRGFRDLTTPEMHKEWGLNA